MGQLVALIGTLLAVMGLVVMAVPGAMRTALKSFLHPGWIPLAVVIRILIGLICIFGADETRLPSVVLAFGVLILLSGFAIPILGFGRIEQLAKFWLGQPDWVVRSWSVMALALGGLLVWAAP